MTSVVSWLPVNAAWVWQGLFLCSSAQHRNTHTSWHLGKERIWDRKEKVENSNSLWRHISTWSWISSSVVQVGEELWQTAFYSSVPTTVLSRKDSAFCWSLSKTEGKKGRKRIIIISFHFGSLIFFWVGAVVRKLSFSPDLKRKAFSKWQMQTSSTTVCSALGKLEVNFQLLTGKRLVSKITLSLNIIL